uniref:Uncharacterized protein n=1 Tax=Zea mays TaxID=4577 RepID=A0A804UJL4_MAIZE
MHLDAEKEMMSQCVALLGKFIAVREPNIRYLGLENFMLFCRYIPSAWRVEIRDFLCQGKVVERLRTELRMGLGFGGRESRRPPLAGSSSADGSTSTPPQRRHSDSSAPSPLHGCT